MKKFSSRHHQLLTKKVTRQKTLKNVMRLGIAKEQKAGKQDRDDSIKQPNPTYL